MSKLRLSQDRLKLLTSELTVLAECYDEQDARRLHAAWSVVDGISTEGVQKLAKAGSVSDLYSILDAHPDMLEVLQRVLHTCEWYADERISKALLADILRSALARIEAPA